MILDYVEDMPFNYKRFIKSKDIQLSDELKTQFNHYYREIKKSDSLSIDEWTKMAASIKSDVEDEVCKRGNKRSIYVEEYVQFIFGVSYLLFDKFHLSQSQVSKILGITPTKFSKLDIFPYRSFQAYTKLNDKANRKSLIPNNVNSEGIRIAEYINTKIQTKYACYAFVGVSNDLDLFANVSTTDKKYFVLTSPLEFDNNDIETIKRANYAFARYQFALGNQLYDDEDTYVPSGKIKERIVQMLQMDDISVFSKAEQDELIQKLLLSEEDLKAYVSTGYHYSEFQSIRDAYKLSYENMQIEKEKLEDDYRNYLVEYYDTDYKPSGSKNNRKFLKGDEVVRKHYQLHKESYERLECKLLECIDIPRLLRSKAFSVKNWIEVIRQSVKKNVIVQIPSGNGFANDNVNFLEPTYEDRLKCAAGYWISEVFADYDGDEEFYNGVLTYLGRRSPLFGFWDALNAPPAGEMKDASSQERKNIHIYMRDEHMDIFSELRNWNVRPNNENVRPLLVYLDTDSVAVDPADIDKLVSDLKAIVIVHDKSKGLQSKIKEFSKELNLYMKCSVEVE